MDATTREKLLQVVEGLRMLNGKCTPEFLTAWKKAIATLAAETGGVVLGQLLSYPLEDLGDWARKESVSLKRGRSAFDSDPDIAVFVAARRLGLEELVKLLKNGKGGLTVSTLTPAPAPAPATAAPSPAAAAVQEAEAGETRECKYCHRKVPIPAGAKGLQIARALRDHRRDCPKRAEWGKRGLGGGGTKAPAPARMGKAYLRELEEKVGTLTQTNAELAARVENLQRENATLAKDALEGRYNRGLYEGYSLAVATLAKAVLA